MIIEVCYIALLICLAKWNADLIENDKKIHHVVQGGLHIALAVLCAWQIHWVYAPMILFTARIWFTSALNLFRGKPLFYITAKPTSVIDKIEQRIFGKNGEAPFFVYLAFWLACNIFLLHSG